MVNLPVVALIVAGGVGLVLRRCTTGYRWRGLLSLVLNSLFLVSLVHGAVVQLIPLALFLTAGYLCLALLQHRSTRFSLSVSLVLILTLFVYLKQYAAIGWVPSLGFAYTVLGMSYLLFRIIHLCVDTYGDSLTKRISPLAYFNYTCFCLCFLSGPIQRYQDYVAQEYRPELPSLSPPRRLSGCLARDQWVI